MQEKACSVSIRLERTRVNYPERSCAAPGAQTCSLKARVALSALFCHWESLWVLLKCTRKSLSRFSIQISLPWGENIDLLRSGRLRLFCYFMFYFIAGGLARGEGNGCLSQGRTSPAALVVFCAIRGNFWSHLVLGRKVPSPPFFFFLPAGDALRQQKIGRGSRRQPAFGCGRREGLPGCLLSLFLFFKFCFEIKHFITPLQTAAFFPKPAQKISLAKSGGTRRNPKAKEGQAVVSAAPCAGRSKSLRKSKARKTSIWQSFPNCSLSQSQPCFSSSAPLFQPYYCLFFSHPLFAAGILPLISRAAGAY